MLACERHPGTGGSYVFLHGLSGASGAWEPLGRALAERTGAGWVAVDLPGHGASGWIEPAGYGVWAAAVAWTVEDVPGPLTVVGHSLGGAVGLLLASGLFGLDVRRCVTVGTKVAWTEQELAGAAKVAAGTPREYPERADALGFWRRVAGVSPDARLPEALVEQVLVETPGGWRLRYDQRAAGLAAAPVAALHALAGTAGVEVLGVRGESDPVLGERDLRAVATRTATVAGAGHSPHLEAVDALAEIVTGQIVMGQIVTGQTSTGAGS